MVHNINLILLGLALFYLINLQNRFFKQKRITINTNTQIAVVLICPLPRLLANSVP